MRRKIATGLLCAAAFAGSIVAPGVAYAGTSSAAATTCYAEAVKPFYSNGTVYATGHAYCSPWADVEITVTITADGAFEGDTDTGVIATPHISDTAAAPNRSGNQKWCTRVDGKYYTGGKTYIISDSECEYSKAF
ncbi:hypothetical protein [Streptomyces chilikensis]|uniref:hypothetical protein n=1 Tax=Streptomyces chilikensis TaxID=1194079 RepID=UPI000AF6FD7C|nr:hypothetical protein [Streptomyces chilikensis]